MELNNREMAILFWMTALAIYLLGNKPTRTAAGGVFKAFLHKKVLTIFFMMVANTLGIVYLLSSLGFWSQANLKTTLLWCCVSSIALPFLLLKDMGNNQFFRRTALELLAPTAIMVFIVGFKPFSLPVELALFPVMVLVAVMAAFSERKNEFAIVHKVMNNLLVIFGAGMFVSGVYQAFHFRDEFFSSANLREFLLPVFLTLASYPVLFAMAVYSSYEQAILRSNIWIKNEEVRKWIKVHMPYQLAFNPSLMARWSRHIAGLGFPDKQSAQDSIVELKAAIAREKNSPVIPVAEGWSPYMAMKFLESEGLIANEYRPSSEKLWSASSTHMQFDDGILPNNLAYHVEGDKLKATELRLYLNMNNPVSPKAEEHFARACIILIAKAVRIDGAIDLTTRLFSADTNKFSDGIYNFELKHDVWGSDKKFYSREMIISIKQEPNDLQLQMEQKPVQYHQ